MSDENEYISPIFLGLGFLAFFFGIVIHLYVAVVESDAYNDLKDDEITLSEYDDKLAGIFFWDRIHTGFYYSAIILILIALVYKIDEVSDKNRLDIDQLNKNQKVNVKTSAKKWFKKGEYNLKLGNYTGAIKCYDKALDMYPNYIEAIYSKGNTLLKLDEYKKAIDCYDDILELDSENLNAWKNKILVLEKTGKVNDVKVCTRILEKLKEKKS